VAQPGGLTLGFALHLVSYVTNADSGQYADTSAAEEQRLEASARRAMRHTADDSTPTRLAADWDEHS